MRITEIVSLVEAKLSTLQTSYTLATSSGNLEETFRLQNEIQETQQTLQMIRELV